MLDGGLQPPVSTVIDFVAERRLILSLLEIFQLSLRDMSADEETGDESPA